MEVADSVRNFPASRVAGIGPFTKPIVTASIAQIGSSKSLTNA